MGQYEEVCGELDAIYDLCKEHGYDNAGPDDLLTWLRAQLEHLEEHRAARP